MKTRAFRSSKRNREGRLVLSLVILIWLSASGSSQSTQVDRVSDLLRKRIDPILTKQPVFCSNELLCGSNILPRFYQQREFVPAWIQGGALNQAALDLIQVIHNAEYEGLKPENYHTSKIDALTRRLEDSRVQSGDWDPDPVLDLEMLLTDAYLLFGSHMMAGLVNPETIQAEWFIKSLDIDLVDVLQNALESNRIWESLDGLHPHHDSYLGLEKALDLYRVAKEDKGWPTVPAGDTLKIGMQGPRVRALFDRLQATEDIADADRIDRDVFDDELENSVRHFQQRHGLLADGKVGDNTLAALNVSFDERIRQLKVNMERWRWLPHTFGERFMLVNIANYEMDIFDKRELVFNSRVIVGKYNRKTPVFSSQITYLELNPYWNIPTIIAVQDLLPKIRKDPTYFEVQGIRVFESWAENAVELDSKAIDWASVAKRRFPYKLRQNPGPQNSLGRIKFMFPNRFAVYLHDTPARELFSHSLRGFSSGCIRVEKPVELAAYLLGDDSGWTIEKIQKIIESRERTIVQIPEAISIFLIYLTAWVDGEGDIHFRDDIYQRDAPLYKALMESPPGGE